MEAAQNFVTRQARGRDGGKSLLQILDRRNQGCRKTFGPIVAHRSQNNNGDPSQNRNSDTPHKGAIEDTPEAAIQGLARKDSQDSRGGGPRRDRGSDGGCSIQQPQT